MSIVRCARALLLVFNSSRLRYRRRRPPTTPQLPLKRSALTLPHRHASHPQARLAAFSRKLEVEEELSNTAKQLRQGKGVRKSVRRG